MGYLFNTDAYGTVTALKAAVLEFNYLAFNAVQAAEFEKFERSVTRAQEQAVQQRLTLKQLNSEYKQLHEEAIKIQSDRRLSKSTRTTRLEPIIERMLDIEEQLLV